MAAPLTATAMSGETHRHKKRRLDSDDTFGTQSLPVGELPVDGQPLDGEQYLALVRSQALAAPNVFFAANNPYAIVSAVTTPAAVQQTGAVLPTEAWKQELAVRFANVKEALSNLPTETLHVQPDRLPKPSNAVGWYIWIHGCAPPEDHIQPGSRNQRSTNGVFKLREPDGAQLLRLSTDHVLGLLEAFPYWLAHRIDIPDEENIEASPVVQPLHARWMFALLARLDARLVSEQISVLRTLARACIATISLARIRRKALHSRTKQNSLHGHTDVLRHEAGAWIVIACIAAIWGQSDLWTDASADLQRVA